MLKCLLFFMPVLATYLLLFKTGYPPATTTNLIFDLKMMQIEKHPIQKLKIMAAGSSVTLGSLRSAMIVDRYHCPYFNFAVDAFQVSETKDLLIIFIHEYRPDYILFCSSTGDFRLEPDPQYLTYAGTSPFIRYRFPELFYFTDYCSIYGLMHRVDRDNHFKYLDPWGGRAIQVPREDINPGWWNARSDFPTKYTLLQYRELDTLCEFLRNQHVKLVFIQTPIRADYINSPQTGRDLFSHFDSCKRIVEAYGGAYLNYYDTTIYVDSLFIDRYHLQATGQRILTGKLLNDLKQIIKPQ